MAEPRFRLTLSADFKDRLVERLAVAPVPVVMGLGLRRAAEVWELIAPPSLQHPAPQAATLRVGRLPEHLRGASHRYWDGHAATAAAPLHVEIGLFDSGGCSAAVLGDGLVRELEEVRLPGPRMERWRPGAPAAPRRRGTGDEPPAAEASAERDGAFSRYAGALGGAAVHGRLSRLAVAIIGVSRLGSLLATALAKAGVSRLVLVDDDVVEEHHGDAMDLPVGDWIGRTKVQAVAELLARIAPAIDVTPIAAPAESALALQAISDCDAIVTAPDRGRPRLLATWCAMAYGRVLLDVGTGVFGSGASFVAGADVRLLLPGGPCLLCVGGLDLARHRETDWRRARAGSLRSLNGMAVGYAMFLLERLVAGDVSSTTWSRLQLGGDGGLEVVRPSFAARAGCQVCASAAVGDQAFAGLRRSGRGGVRVPPWSAWPVGQ